MSIRVAIVGYGNLGRGVEMALKHNPDMELVGIYSRRDPAGVATLGGKAFHMDSLLDHKDSIDVAILCGGSKEDLPTQTPALAKHFNTVDSFDTHAKILEYEASITPSALEGKKVALISMGWDPGMFSLHRLYSEAVLPNGENYTFWGKGLSQGHSDAIRRVEGVAAGVQYTIPSSEAMQAVRSGSNPDLNTKDKHKRECFVVLKSGADATKVEQAIKTMPDYFEPYDTTVHFITKEELDLNHSKMPHGGFVIRSGATSSEHKDVLEYSIALDSNAEFTASVLVAYARAAYRLHKMGECGVKTAFDIAPALLSIKSREEIIKEML